jgi:hypothetical protein
MKNVKRALAIVTSAAVLSTVDPTVLLANGCWFG